MTRLLGCMALCLLIHCKKNEEAKVEVPEPNAGAADVKSTATEHIEPEKMAPANPEDFKTMKHCPSGVNGSSTKVVMKEGAPMVVVVAEDEASIKDIQKRGRYLSSLSKERGEVKHLGDGQGGGLLGKCPVVVGSIDRLEDHPNGVRMFLKDDNIGQKELFALATKRLKAMGAQATRGEVPNTSIQEHGSGRGKGNGGGQGKTKVRGLPKN